MNWKKKNFVEDFEKFYKHRKFHTYALESHDTNRNSHPYTWIYLMFVLLFTGWTFQLSEAFPPLVMGLQLSFVYFCALVGLASA
jgi:hypothetical protein